MKKNTLTILIFLILILIPGQLKPAFFPYLMYEKQLANRMRIVVIPMKNARYVSFATMVMTGSRDEIDPGYSGYAHLLEHMMFRGSENFSTDDRVRIMYRYGGDSNAYTGMDYTCYTVRCDPEGWKEILHMEADRLLRLSIKEDDFKAETGAVIGEFGISEKYPSSMMSNLLRACMFKGHTYEYPVIGYREDVMNMPSGHKYVREFYEKNYRPDKTVMFIAGKIDKPGDVLTEAESLFSEWIFKPGPVSSLTHSLKSVSCKDTLYNPAIPSPLIKIAWKIPGYEQDIKGHMSAAILAEHYFSDSSPLITKLRDDKKWISRSSYSVPFTIDPFWISLDLTLTEEGMNARIPDFINGFLQDSRYEINESDLRSVRDRYFYRTSLRLESAASVLGVLTDYSHVNGDPQELNRFFLNLDRLELYDIRDFKSKYLIKNNQSYIWMLKP
ncbi:MAG TPA: insulinase family protein [Candidatus Marinimicrobia bacterium]|nr:insulinase family protein [Candidatus Neomarinimicrobiota bacterium]